jgi:hypothetical protein
MAFSNIDLLSTHRTDTSVQVAKAFTDCTEADHHLVMNTDLSSFFYITRQVIPRPISHSIEQVPDFGRPKLQPPASIKAGLV